MSESLAPPTHDSLEGVPAPSETLTLFGHGEARRRVLDALGESQMPHALLLSGPRGVGKATFAFHLARHLLGGRGSVRDFMSADPASALYRQVASGAHPAVLHLTRPLNDKTEKFKTALTVDEVRRIGRFLGMTAHDGGWRIVIVDPADDMNANAANALLKNLEEPPARVLFALITHSGARILPTIRSRCQVLRFAPLDDENLVAAGTQAGLAWPSDDATRRGLLIKAAGSVREAIVMSRHGGLDLGHALQRIAATPKLDLAVALKLAEKIGARDAEQAFTIANDVALGLVAEEAGRAARSGERTRAERISRQWQAMRIAVRETETYNLDRKQHALTMIQRLHETFRM